MLILMALFLLGLLKAFFSEKVLIAFYPFPCVLEIFSRTLTNSMANKEAYILHSDTGPPFGFIFFSRKQGRLYLEMKISDPYPVTAEQFLSFRTYNSLKAIIWVKLDIRSKGIGMY